MKDIRKLIAPTMLLLNVGFVVAGDNAGSQEASAPGFQVIGSLIALGIIAFLAPLLRRDKSENQ
ncbi:MAG: hypothetical protein GPJ54_13775 [Candidatus Heimdallarchaeota archaeon]|nr:hypothetical protein [Candidatus Heimdallarchaeota archaeon]